MREIYLNATSTVTLRKIIGNKVVFVSLVVVCFLAYEACYFKWKYQRIWRNNVTEAKYYRIYKYLSKSLWEEEMFSNPQLFRTETVLILALSVNHLHITFHELPKDEAKGQKSILKLPVENMAKKEKPNNNGNIKSVYLIVLDYSNQGVRIVNTWSYLFLVFHLLPVFKNNRHFSQHFICVIDYVNLLKTSSGERNSFFWRLCPSDPCNWKEEEKDW